MKTLLKIMLVYALVSTAAALWGFGRSREARRLEQNQTVLCDSLHRYRTRLGAEAASVAALQLRCEEFARLRADDAATIKSLGLRLRRLESLSTTSTAAAVEVRTILHDTIILRDTVRTFSWRDPWTSIEGCIAGDSVACAVASVDTLRQVVHRVPRRFLFIRWGTKSIRQEIVSSNPHTRIVAAEYVEFADRRGGLRRRRR